MNPFNRRSFLQLALSGAACSLAPGRVIGANDRIRIAAIGLGGRGVGIAGQAVRLGGVELVALCDADSKRLDAGAAKLLKQKAVSEGVRKETDFRKLLEDPEIDAVLIATPNHWHALMTVMACEAGKDVMVEKPVCHTLDEGWRMIKAAKKQGRIVCGGFQQRADSGLLALQDYLKAENDPYGAVTGIHARGHQDLISLLQRAHRHKPLGAGHHQPARIGRAARH
ncbi:MAG: Gfo/Idh/MocA family oxidoreductase, partial [Verrucomicrobiota bacterium]